MSDIVREYVLSKNFYVCDEQEREILKDLTLRRQ